MDIPMCIATNQPIVIRAIWSGDALPCLVNKRTVSITYVIDLECCIKRCNSMEYLNWPLLISVAVTCD
jgi:hypothetical protein